MIVGGSTSRSLPRAGLVALFARRHHVRHDRAMRAVPFAPMLLTLMAGGCEGPADVAVRVDEVLALSPPECVALRAAPLTGTTLLDIGFDSDTANSAIVALAFEVFGEDAAGTLITLTTSDVVFRGVLDSTPRRLGLMGVTSEQFGGEADIAFMTPIPREDAIALQGDDAVVASLRAPDDRMRIEVDVILEGSAQRIAEDSAPPAYAPRTIGSVATVRSEVFTLPIDLCVGCLVPRCANGEVALAREPNGVCVRGQDIALTCEAP